METPENPGPGARDQLMPRQSLPAHRDAVFCPVCGAPAVQEKCKLICKSEICRGRVIMNCSEF